MGCWFIFDPPCQWGGGGGGGAFSHYRTWNLNTSLIMIHGSWTWERNNVTVGYNKSVNVHVYSCSLLLRPCNGHTCHCVSVSVYHSAGVFVLIYMWGAGELLQQYWHNFSFINTLEKKQFRAGFIPRKAGRISYVSNLSLLYTHSTFKVLFKYSVRNCVRNARSVGEFSDKNCLSYRKILDIRRIFHILILWLVD